MKYLILKILLLVAGFTYTASILELDANESKENYQKETHSYIHQGFEKLTDQVVKITGKDDYSLYTAAVCNYLRKEIEPTLQPVVYKVYSPPKQHILHSVFLI